MTCIVGLVDKGQVIIGGDSAAISGWNLAKRSDRKVFRNGEYVIGFTTSFRMGQLLAFGFNPPKPAGEDLLGFMATEFVDAVRQRLKDGGFAKTKDAAEEGGNFLVGFRGRLFNIEGDYQVGENAFGFDACGCGAQAALGSMRATRRWRDGMARVQEALATAEEFSAGVRGPFVVEAA